VRRHHSKGSNSCRNGKVVRIVCTVQYSLSSLWPCMKHTVPFHPPLLFIVTWIIKPKEDPFYPALGWRKKNPYTILCVMGWGPRETQGERESLLGFPWSQKAPSIPPTLSLSLWGSLWIRAFSAPYVPRDSRLPPLSLPLGLIQSQGHWAGKE